LGHAIIEIDQIEPADHFAVLADQDVKHARAGLLRNEQFAEELVEVVEEFISTVGDKGGKVGAIRPFERKDRGRMVSPQAL
jgi:hypothetical protein